MVNFHVFRVKYCGPTNVRGSRVKIITDRFKQSVYIPFDHRLNNTEDMAAAYLEGRGYHVVGLAEGLVITDTFKGLRSIEYVVQGHYGGSAGWEDLTAETTRSEARDRLREYRENEPEHRHRIIERKEN